MIIPHIEHEEIIVIGDIHGCADELRELISKLPLDSDCAVVMIGDFIDRGPDSRKVIETVLDLSRSVDLFPLMGNHESMLLEFLNDPWSLQGSRFLLSGGGATLESYSNVPGTFDIPRTHLQFLRGLPMVCESSSYIFVHAGLPNARLADLLDGDHAETLLWVREEFHQSGFEWGKTVVHGHSPVRQVLVTSRRINVDTGCVYDNMLSAIHLPSHRIYSVEKRTLAEHAYLREPPTSRRRAVRFSGQIDVALTQPQGLPIFHTLNFNDFGVLMVNRWAPSSQLLRKNDQIAGVLFPTDRFSRERFTGVVVHVASVDGTYQYGVRFDRPASIDT
ncbi:MAG: metallophosphoesterase [Polyangiaceae bacterium]|nr:metallophosphoesterase [Polyangiaceae bacterium]